MEVMDNYKLRINNIINRHYGMYMSNSNIVGVGLGNKIINGTMTDIPSLTIFVKKKLSLGELSFNYRIPKYINGVITDVYESGVVKPLAKEVRPAVGGISIGDSMRQTDGTLGYAVTDKKGERLYILSCAHAIAASNKIDSPPQRILQPSLPDGGEARKSFMGVVAKVIPIKNGMPKLPKDFNEVDAGLVYIGQNTLKTQMERLSPILLNKVGISGTSKVKVGDKVWKIGRSTGKTSGKVISVGATERIEGEFDYDFKIFKNQITTDLKNDFGDSGSIGVIENTTKAFGLLASGSETVTHFNDIDRVLELLEVKIAYALV